MKTFGILAWSKRAWGLMAVAVGVLLVIAGSASATERNMAITPGHAWTTDLSQLCGGGYHYTPVPHAARVAAMAAYHIDKGAHGVYVVRLIPPSWGGDASVANLLPMTQEEMVKKDRLVTYGHAKICSGEMDAQAAQHEIAADWQAMYDHAFSQEHVQDGAPAR